MKRALPVCTFLALGLIPHVCSANANRPARWTNNLGMVFVLVPDTAVAFCIWETRLQDYAAFVNEGHWARLLPRKPDFVQGTNHPVVNVSLEEAKAFCI